MIVNYIGLAFIGFGETKEKDKDLKYFRLKLAKSFADSSKTAD
jgi:hypothetical protein